MYKEQDKHVNLERETNMGEQQSPEAKADKARELQEELGNPDAISELKEQIETLKSQVLRAQADNENLRKRFARELEDGHKYAVSKLAIDLTEVLENLFRATENTPAIEAETDARIENFIQGIAMTQKLFVEALERHGVARVYPLHDTFNHTYHEALSQQENTGKPANTITEVVRAGYTLNDRSIKPALVIVAK